MNKIGVYRKSDDRNNCRKSKKLDNAVQQNRRKHDQRSASFTAAHQGQNALSYSNGAILIHDSISNHPGKATTNSWVWARSGPMLTMRMGVRVRSSISFT